MTDSTDWKLKSKVVGWLIVFFPPLGLYLLWTHPTWTTKAKWIVTGGYAAFIIFACAVSKDEKSDHGTRESQSELLRPTTKPAPPAVATSDALKTIAVAGAEPDRKKWESASRPIALSFSDRKISDRIAVFKSIVKKLKDFPDRLASDRQKEKFSGELRKLIDEFREIPFNGSYQTEDARTIIDLWEKEIENKYRGGHYNQLEDEVANIFQQFRSRPE